MTRLAVPAFCIVHPNAGRLYPGIPGAARFFHIHYLLASFIAVACILPIVICYAKPLDIHLLTSLAQHYPVKYTDKIPWYRTHQSNAQRYHQGKQRPKPPQLQLQSLQDFHCLKIFLPWQPLQRLRLYHTNCNERSPLVQQSSPLCQCYWRLLRDLPNCQKMCPQKRRPKASSNHLPLPIFLGVEKAWMQA